MTNENGNIEINKERYTTLFNENIKRDGADRLLEWLGSSKCDFFTAAAGTKLEADAPGGLCEHSIRVFESLCDYMRNTDIGKSLRDRAGREFSDESLAVVALLHDIYKIKTYKKEVKDGIERMVEDVVPYGLAEKSVYMISGFIRLSDDEAFAIRYHKGFSVGSTDDRRTIGSALEKFNLAYALNICDMAASYFE